MVKSTERVCYYDTLGLEPNCSMDDVRHAYHELSKIYHPDKYNSSCGMPKDEASAKFLAIKKNPMSEPSTTPTARPTLCQRLSTPTSKPPSTTLISTATPTPAAAFIRSTPTFSTGFKEPHDEYDSESGLPQKSKAVVRLNMKARKKAKKEYNNKVHAEFGIQCQEA
ncbi:uncharacterized protein LOC121050619 [Rosa chinensis]|uniref:uncharacterized protein LOC121050619 n=1 Tax=Rosa chinensis TaxID=74649 RepID=UPI001AD8D323|nr:uncharacterized protein LOC121050619 [Rosa chinensis]